MIPDMARVSNLLIAILLIQLLASVYWLISDPDLLWINFALYTLYLQWFVLLTLMALHFLRSKLKRASKFALLIITLVIVTVVLFVVESATSYLLSSGSSLWPRGDRFFRFWLASVLCVAALYRVFQFLEKVKVLNQAESESRLEALQARIQPHFLFNSLNTIAELTSTMPQKAEEAIHALAMLFRVSLENRDSQHSLDKELALCERFISLEAWRYSDGIDIKRDIEIKRPKKWLVPKLLLQPLLENAIKYGNPAETERPIKMTIRENRRSISIKIVNAVTEQRDSVGGHGIAMQNIRDRLFALYEDRYTFSQREVEGEHYLLIQLPKVRVPKT